MTLRTVPHTRPAPQRRPGVRVGSGRHVPLALVLSPIPVSAGSLRLLEVAGGPQLLPTNPRIDASPAPLVMHVIGSGRVINAAVAEWVVRRPGARRAGRARTTVAGSR
jgi:hypothetical protein